MMLIMIMIKDDNDNDNDNDEEISPLDICRFEMVGAKKVKFHSTSVRPDSFICGDHFRYSVGFNNPLINGAIKHRQRI